MDSDSNFNENNSTKLVHSTDSDHLAKSKPIRSEHSSNEEKIPDNKPVSSKYPERESHQNYYSRQRYEIDNLDSRGRLLRSTDQINNSGTLRDYHGTLLKLIELLEDDCINEDQLKEIIINLKNKAKSISWTETHEISSC